MSLLLTRHMDCCCEGATAIVFECFPMMCPDGWTKLFGYSAGIRRDDLRFFVRCDETALADMVASGFPNRDFVWWDHELGDVAQRYGGGQVWKVRKDPGSASNLATHRDYLYGTNEEDLPADPRDFITAVFPKGLRPPPNAFGIEDDDGVFLEVVMYSRLDETRKDIITGGFSDKPGRLTNSEFDRYTVDTLPPVLDPEFTFLELEFTPTDFPAFFELKVDRANHLFHHLWNLCFANYQTFGQPDEFDLPSYAEPGSFQPTFPGSSPDTELNIYFWQRWIAHAEPTGSGMYGLQFAVQSDYWDQSRSYHLSSFTNPNAPACGTSYADALAQFAAGTADCDRFYTREEDLALPNVVLSQLYELSPTGASFQLAPPGGLINWPRGDGTPTYPQSLRNKSGDGSDGCLGVQGGNSCNNEWGLGVKNSLSSLLNFEYVVEQVKVTDIQTNSETGVLTSDNDPFQILLGVETYDGSVDNYEDDQVDHTNTSPRRFQWPSTMTMQMNITANYQSVDPISCPTDSQFSGFIVDPGIQNETKRVKFPICELLEEELAVDVYTDKMVDRGVVITMDGRQDRGVEDYFHMGINYAELYSTCSGRNFIPGHSSSSGLVNFSAGLNGLFKLSATTQRITVYGDTICSTDPTPQTTGCTISTPSGCKADMVCGANVGFAMDREFNDNSEPAQLYYSHRGLYTLGKEPATTFGTVTN